MKNIGYEKKSDEKEISTEYSEEMKIVQNEAEQKPLEQLGSSMGMGSRKRRATSDQDKDFRGETTSSIIFIFNVYMSRFSLHSDSPGRLCSQVTKRRMLG